jgi:hypothetical protein
MDTTNAVEDATAAAEVLFQVEETVEDEFNVVICQRAY